MRPTQKSRRGSDSPHTAVRCKFDTRSPKTSRASAWTGRTNRRQNHISQHTVGGRKPSRQAKNNALTKGIRGQKYHRRAHENRRTCDDRRVSERMHPPPSGKSTEKANQQARCPSALTGQTAEAPRKPHENGENPQALESNQASIENSTGAVGKTFRTRHSRSLPILQSNNASVKGKRRVLCRMQKVYFAGLDKARAIRYNQGRRFLLKG